MKLVTFERGDGTQHIGALTDGERAIAVLQAGARAMDGAPSPLLADMLAFLRGGAQARDKASAVLEYITAQRPPGATVALDDVALLAPVPRPESVRDFMAFEQHIINSIRAVGLRRLGPLDEWIERTFGRKRSIAYRLNKAWYERPIYYKSNRFSVVGTDAEVRAPAYTRRFDYELEWGVFIGRQGVDIPPERAGDFIGGYTIFNDFSARDIQMAEMGGRLGPAKGKDFDTGNAMGPCLVTPDEIPDPYSLTMTARINGEEWSRGDSGDMHWTFEDLIAYVSRSETLYPGEFFGSGTCSGPQGRGCGLELGRFLRAGDVVELEVERIGLLRNQVVEG
jgi:2-keto-4-pentenoate hydratase/2-oxohepta-3-ene-1,7-dioic acid hydratase in catechol pathway